MPGLSLHDSFSATLYTGGGLSTRVPSNFPVAINGHPFLIDVTRYSRRFLPATSDQQDTSTEPGESSLSREGFWPRSQSRFDLGAGQLFFDEEGASRRRWYTSKGIDPWTDRRSLCLQRDTEKKGTVTTSAAKVLSVGGYLYVADGANLRLTADPTGTSPTWTTIACGGTIADIATDGDNVYIAIAGANIQKTAVGASSLTAWGTATAQPTVLAYANGRLFGAVGPVISEIASTGIASAIRTDPRTTASWVAIVGTPGSLFAAINAGSRGYIYSFSVDDVTTAVGAATLAGELPAGESVYSLAYYGGTLLVGTSSGLRAAPTDGARVNIGELIDLSKPVRCFAAEAEFVWFGWSNFDASSTGTGRANLATNTSESTYVPAYASDVMAGTDAAVIQGNVLSVARHGSRTYFVVSGVGLYGSLLTYVTSGTYNTGWIRFSTLVAKLFTGVQLGHDALAGTVAAAVVFEDGTTRNLGTSGMAGSTISDLLDASGEGVAAQLVLTLTRGSTTAGPCVRYWTLNALPVPRRVREIIVPLIIKLKDVDLRNNVVSFDPLAELEFLEALASANSLVTYQEGDKLETVRVDNVAVAEKDMHAFMEPAGRGGNPTRMWFQGGTVTVRLLTREE